MTINDYIKIALIPAYQPNNRLIKLVEELHQNGFTIIVVNDGSDPICSRIFSAVEDSATLISYPENHGKGYALKKGMAYISKNFKPDFVLVTLDADGQHTVFDALRLSQKANDNKDCMLLGSRDFMGKVPFKSLFGNTLTRFVFKLRTGVRVFDTQTGLRAFSDRLIDTMLNISGDRYEYEMNVLLQCCADRIPIVEVKTATIYENGNKGSHFNPVKDSIKIYKAIFGFKAKKGRTAGDVREEIHISDRV